MAFENRRFSIILFFIFWLISLIKAEHVQSAFFFFLKNYFYDLKLPLNIYTLYAFNCLCWGICINQMIYNAIQPIVYIFKLLYSRVYYEMYLSYATIYDVCFYVFVWYFVNFAISFTSMLFRFLSNTLFRSHFKLFVTDIEYSLIKII